MNLNTFLQNFKGFYSNENKNRLSWTLLAAMLKVEVVLHFILKKIQNINYLGENFHVMSVVLAEFLRNSCLSKPQITCWVFF